MSPGVLLSTGYIAGGAIAGVLIAFLSFSDEIPRQLSVWQYRQTAIDRLNRSRNNTKTRPPSNWASRRLRPAMCTSRRSKTWQARSAISTRTRLPPYIPVPRGTELTLPNQEPYKTETDTTLGKVAREMEGSSKRAALLLNLNADTLKVKAPGNCPSAQRSRCRNGIHRP